MPAPCCAGRAPAAPANARGAQAYFARMIENCLAFAQRKHAEQRPIVGILCEYTPRELILAAGGFPVCLCGGSAATIPPAEEHLPGNLCPLIKSTYGYHLTRTNPFLEMAAMVVAETTCDGKKKMYELMAEERPLYVLELPQRENDPRALERWVIELRRLRGELELRFGHEITDEALREAIRWMNRERRLRRRLAELMAADAPPLTGLELLALKSSLAGNPEDLEQLEKAYEELKAAAPVKDAGRRARVLLTGVPTPHGAERVVELIEAHGGLIVCMENCTGVKPILEDVDKAAEDPLRALAEKYYHLPCSVMTPNENRQASLLALAQKYRPDCVIELVWQACLTYDVESRRTRRLAEAALGVPYLRIETDYSPSDSARLAVRVEALFETVRARKASPPPGAGA